MSVDTTTNPQKVNGSTPSPRNWVRFNSGPLGPMVTSS